MQARSVTETARRSQIVEAALRVIARDGHAQASFGRIASEAGLSSTGLISYHFSNKADLIAACIAEAERIAEAFMQPRLSAADGVLARIRAYVEANVALVGAHPVEVAALIELLSHTTSSSSMVDGRIERFVDQFQQGQRADVLRRFDVGVAATAIVAGLDAVVAAAAASPPGDAELVDIGRELADLYVAAIVEPETPRS